MGKSFLIALFGLIVIVGSGFLWFLFNVSRKKRLLNKLLSMSKEKRFFWHQLQKEGFEIIAPDQIEKYNLTIDGKTKTFSLKADFIVRKKSSKYVAIYIPASDEKELLRLFFIYNYIFQTNGVIFYDETNRNYSIWQEE